MAEEKETAKKNKILLFGGTSEGRILAEEAFGQWECHVYVATEEGAEFLPREMSEQRLVHIGRLDAEQMAEQIRKYQPQFVMDATHPYAVEVSKNIKSACEKENAEYLRVLRESSPVADGIMADNAEDAARILTENYRDSAVLLTTGSKELPAFAAVLSNNPKVYARILPGEENRHLAEEAGVLPEHILTGVGPFTEAQNLEVLQKYGIRVLVTKESGSRGGFAEKISAAGKAGADVIVIRRPVEEEGIRLERALEILRQNKSETTGNL